MAKKIATEEQIEDIKELAGFACCAMDNLYAGLQEHPTGMHNVTECFTKQEHKTLHKAIDLLWKIRNDFDGIRKQRNQTIDR